MLQVRITNRQRLIPVRRALWRRMLRTAAPRAWTNARLSVVAVGEAEMVDLNRRFTGRDGDTDVLAFPLEDMESASRSEVGEIIVCASRAVSEARARGIRPEDELALYVAHGFVHLLGYDDHKPEDRKRMYAAEAELMSAAGVLYVRQRARICKAGGGKRKK